MSDQRKAVRKALNHNLDDVVKHGPRLSYNRRTAVTVTCKQENLMMLTGLGGMGVGSMWVKYDAERAGDAPDFPTLAEADQFHWDMMLGGR